MLATLTGAVAGEEDRLKWAVAEAEALRYEIEADDAARAAPDANAAPVIARMMIVSGGDFETGRRPKLRVSEFGDIVWFFALELPPGEFKKSGESPIAEKFDVNNVGAVA